MADATGRALTLVNRPSSTTPTQEQFGARIQAILQQHGDIASEGCWQEMAVLVAEQWQLLGHEQPPLASWAMLSRCVETILKVRRGQRQDERQSGADALEEFRRFMGEVLGRDEGA